MSYIARDFYLPVHVTQLQITEPITLEGEIQISQGLDVELCSCVIKVKSASSEVD